MTPSRLSLDYSLLDLLNMLRRHVAWILWPSLLAVGVAALAVQFLIPARYESHASILPEQSSEVTAKMPILQRGAFRSAFKFGDVTTRNSTNLELMVSDRVRRAVVRKLNLADFFGVTTGPGGEGGAEQRAMEALTRSTRLEMALQIQVLFVRVATRDAAMSARIVEAYLEATDVANLERIHEHARQRVAFYDARLVELQGDLALARAQLAGQIAGSGIADPERERNIAYDFLQPLQEKLLQLRLQRDRLAQDQLAVGAERQALTAEIAVYEGFLADFDTLSGAGPGVLPAPGRSELAGMERSRLQRELALLEALEISLREGREAARLEATLEAETLTILDHPVLAAEPTWPRKRLTVMLTGLIGLITTSSAALFIDALRRLGEGSARSGLRQLLRET
jgi:uncharacterized protein involved in exopolysaccharide biosynthesis